MGWVYICISIGALAFLVYVFIEYLQATSGLRPKSEAVLAEIQRTEGLIELEELAAKEAAESLAAAQKEITELERTAKKMAAKLKALQAKEKRRNPTRFKVDD